MAQKKPNRRKRSASSKPKRPTGRQTKCTPELTERIAAMVQEGKGLESAARAAGIGEATVRRWMVDGEEPDDGPLDPKKAPYRAFRRRIVEARDAIETEIDTVLFATGLRSKNERIATETARWLGERLLPHKYGKRQEVRQVGHDGGAVKTEVAATVEHSGTVAVQPLVSDDQLKNMDGEQLGGFVAGLLSGLESDQKEGE